MRGRGKGQDYRPVTTLPGNGPSLGGKASPSSSGSFPLDTREALFCQRLSLCICEMGPRVRIGGSRSPRPGRWPTRSSSGHLFSQSESPRHCAPLSGGSWNRWRRTRWRAAATPPLVLAGPRNLRRAACACAPRKPCLPIAATPRPPQDPGRPTTLVWGKAQIVEAPLWYGLGWMAWVEAGTRAAAPGSRGAADSKACVVLIFVVSEPGTVPNT